VRLVSTATISDFEKGRRGSWRTTVARLQAALESAGVIFLIAGIMFIEEKERSPE
jgi:hypothetical protein